MLSRLKALRRWALRAVDYHVGAQIRWRWLQRALRPLLAGKALRVLDAGSGSGLYTFRLGRRYPRCTFHGIELDAAHVATCQARLQNEALPNLTFAQGDLTQPLLIEPVDLAYSVDVLEHIGDDGAALRHLAQAMRPGGRLFIHTPLIPQRHWLRRFDLERAPRDDHVRQGYLEEELRAKVRAAGLEPVCAMYTHGRWGTLAWELWQMLRWQLVPKFVLWPLAMVLIAVELLSPPAWGNCILLESRKPEARTDNADGSEHRSVKSVESVVPGRGMP